MILQGKIINQTARNLIPLTILFLTHHCKVIFKVQRTENKMHQPFQVNSHLEEYTLFSHLPCHAVTCHAWRSEL